MEHTKPFDLEAFKAGAPHATKGGTYVRFIVALDDDEFSHINPNSRLVIALDGSEYPETYNKSGRYVEPDGTDYEEDLVQVPFTIHRGRPLYYGDVLWSPSWGQVTVKVIKDGRVHVEYDKWEHLDNLAWPKQSRTLQAFEVPMPETEPLQHGAVYFCPANTCDVVSYSRHTWGAYPRHDLVRLQRGMVHRSEEDAILVAEAIAKALSLEIEQ